MIPDPNTMQSENAFRQACIDCGRKHLGKARSKMLEARLGYPRHAWYAVAELSEAEDELVQEYPEVAAEIRRARLSLIESLDPATSVAEDGALVIDLDAVWTPPWDRLMDALIVAALE